MSTAAVRRIAASAGLPEAVIQEALEWLVMVWSREATAQQLQALEQWRAADPRHERAWQQVRQLNANLATVPESVASNSLRAADRAISRRNFVLALALGATGGLAAVTARDTTLIERRFADARTATGEIRELTLADGTRLTLNTASAVEVDFTDRMRRLRLITGEVLITTAPDPLAAQGRAARPFLVETVDGEVRPIGTRFTVRHTGAGSQVAVLEGKVEITPQAVPASGTRLEAGRRARFSRTRVETLPDTGAAAAWAEGWLVAEQVPLGELLAELGRYRAGILRCDPAVAALPVSGTYPVTDTDRALTALAAALPIRVIRVTRYWVTVTAA